MSATPEFPFRSIAPRLIAVTLCAFALPFAACKQKPQGAKIAPRIEKAPEKALSNSSEPWIDLLQQPEKLALQNGAEFRGSALRLASRSAAKIRDSAAQNDGAIRLVAVLQPGESGPVIAARIQDGGARYTLAVSSETTVRLAEVLGNGEETPLKDFTLARSLPPAKPYELELRVAGSTLTARLNGELVGEVNDTTFPSGMMQVGLDVASPVLIGALQYLPLGNSAPATTGATEHWTNVLEDTDFLSKNPGIKKAGDGGFTVSGWTNILSQSARNCAVRLTLDNSQRATALRVSIRASSAGQYALNLRANQEVSVRRYVTATKDDNVLIAHPLPANTGDGSDLVIELRAVGPRLTVKINGEEAQTAEDTALKEGQIGLGASKQAIEEYGEPKVKKLEYAVLD
jgi:hypothetical protein